MKTVEKNPQFVVPIGLSAEDLNFYDQLTDAIATTRLWLSNCLVFAFSVKKMFDQTIARFLSP